jgi:hypothetical protein
MMLWVPRLYVKKTFVAFRTCGRGRSECQVLWVASWSTPDVITRVVHPRHSSHRAGFEVDNAWLTDFCYELAAENQGVRVQVHTHPADAFHSSIDDMYPFVQTPGFLSLVIPNFGMGAISLEDAYLAELQAEGCWIPRSVDERIGIRE